MFQKEATKGAERWQSSRGRFYDVGSVAKNLKFHNADMKQNIVLRNAQMFIGRMQQGLRRLNCIVSNVARYFISITAMKNEESIVRMNVLINRMSRLKNVSVHFAKQYLKSIRQVRTFVVRGNVGLRGQKLHIGLHLKNCFVNVCNVEKSFGENYRTLSIGVVNFVHEYARMNFKPCLLGVIKGAIFMEAFIGKNYAKLYCKETIINANRVDLMEKIYTYTIRKEGEMVEKIRLTTLSFCVPDATGFFTRMNDLFLQFLGKSWLENCKHQPL